MIDSSGLYLHIPFCHSKCTYCTFVTGSYEDLLARRYLDALASEIRAQATKLAPDAEITAEMNPSDIDPARLQAYRSMGINRASVGIQSFIDTQLQAMGR